MEAIVHLGRKAAVEPEPKGWLERVKRAACHAEALKRHFTIAQGELEEPPHDEPLKPAEILDAYALILDERGENIVGKNMQDAFKLEMPSADFDERMYKRLYGNKWRERLEAARKKPPSPESHELQMASAELFRQTITPADLQTIKDGLGFLRDHASDFSKRSGSKALDILAGVLSDGLRAARDKK